MSLGSGRLGPEDPGPAFPFPSNPHPQPKRWDPGCDSRQVWPQWSGLRQSFLRNWGGSRFSPVDVCLGPSSGMTSAGLTALLVPAGVSGPEPANGQLPKGFYNLPWGGGPLWLVSASPLMSKGWIWVCLGGWALTVKEAVSSCQHVRPWSAGKGEGEPRAVGGREKC